MMDLAEKSLDDLTLADRFELDELVDRQALAEVTRSLEDLFGVSLRLYGTNGRLLADTGRRLRLYEYLEEHGKSRAALHEVVARVRRAQPASGPLGERCVSGAHYRIVAVSYEGRPIGRVILGPYRASQDTETPPALFEAEPGLDRERVAELLEELPVLSPSTVEGIERHLQATLDLLLFSGLKALLASNMHLATVRESYRELQEKSSRLQAAYERLKELDRLKSNFLATISHELRTPLTSIIGYSEMMLEGISGELSEEQHEFVSTIHGKGEQLLGLIRSLLDLSKLESGTMSLRRTNVSVASLVQDILATLAPSARKKSVDLRGHQDGELPPLWADVERLRQVLLNLCENAIKFTPAGGSVTLIARAGSVPLDGGQGAGSVLLLPARRPAVELLVADTGVGIEEEERGRVFDAFYQVDSGATREQGGTGLGLSIVKRLVEAHGGTIRIESNQPRGTVFVVTLPVEREST
ncbi:MAG: histidine kinase [Myxococcales bacterium]|jgi:two-component system sensor histidine kinase BarA|nr:histidine kinase [Myxococcales bacterium]